MPSLIGTDIAANYLVVKQSPGAAYADKDGNVITSAPLLTFATPNLQMFKVALSTDVTVDPLAHNSDWSKAIRALQVTSEIFAVFPPASDGEGGSVFCYMAPDFNTNAGAASETGSAQAAVEELGGDFSVVENALSAALGASANVTRCMLVGTAVA